MKYNSLTRAYFGLRTRSFHIKFTKGSLHKQYHEMRLTVIILFCSQTGRQDVKCLKVKQTRSIQHYVVYFSKTKYAFIYIFVSRPLSNVVKDIPIADFPLNFAIKEDSFIGKLCFSILQRITHYIK